MDRIRILHCLETVGSGGVEQRRLTLARQLDGARYEQALVCTQAVGALPARFAEAGCPLHAVGVFRGVLDREPYRQALRVVREFRPHIIHGAVFEGVSLATLLGRLARVPVIIGEETSDPVNRRWRGHLLLRLLGTLSHQMVAVSPAVEQYLLERLHLPRSKVTLINNGVAEMAPPDENQIRALREQFELAPDHFVIGTVGRLLDRHKRVSDLIRALAALLPACPEARLLIVGRGPDEGMLRELAGQLGVAAQVRFAGYQADPQPCYALMDVFALASAMEAFGLVLVEAMQAGLPVVATRVGGIPGVVDEGASGLLVPPGQPPALAEALLALQRDPARRQAMGRAGQRLAAANFGAERYVRDVDRLYRRLAAQRIGP
ncbi:glycosyltransferase [Azotobacter beijerinckii]|uniref:Glycosyltransferase involved in cell wall bisynthesis n=1 Tax=Azotobacter beijerinckii TaxID=170623 RepID=A0A1I4BMP7_9GAMM|nr:glycosyltransferase [Azotobacter beijerinckii]SFB10833.1 Glycosyltransferase involved in cell wall bisynthesis [Azotobacter beijerinckii]SFK69467.1 Glycosyltransferase involved in cell wall bisynthesis [Azotobacter beijerinckii]